MIILKMNRLLLLLLLVRNLSLFASDAAILQIHLEQVDSTQLFVKAHAGELIHQAGEWAMVSADSQTAGCGHEDHSWVSPPSENIYVTYVTFYPREKDQQVSHVIQLSSLAVLRTLRDFGLESKIKWENDVMVDDKKIAGCLCELMPSHLADHYFLLIGIGLNVNMTLQDIMGIACPATSIFIETETMIDKKIVLGRLSTHLQEIIIAHLKEGSSSFLEELNQCLLYKDEMVKFKTQDGTIIEGKIRGINENTALLLEIEEQIVPFRKGKILGRI